jgi:hypothetical protein
MDSMSVREQIPVKAVPEPVPHPQIPAPFGILQRKCACGGSGNGCEECKKKALQRRASREGAGRIAFAKFGRQSLPSTGVLAEAAAPPSTAPGFGYDFSRVRVSALCECSASLPGPEGYGRLHQGKAGETGCDVSTGTPSSSIYSPSICYRTCTERHEAVHVADLTPCCKRANQKYNAAKTENEKTAIQDKMDQWIVDNKNYFECRGYGESVRCAEEFLAAHCQAPKSEQSSQTSGDQPGAAETPETANQAADINPAAAPAAEGLSALGLAEDPPQPTPVNPENCCAPVKEYRRVQGLRRDIFCGAKKSLASCPV